MLPQSRARMAMTALTPLAWRCALAAMAKLKGETQAGHR